MTTPTHTTVPLDLSWVEFSEEESTSCEHTKVDCSLEAAWELSTKCCGYTLRLCDPHKINELDIHSRGAELYAGGVEFVCDICGNSSLKFELNVFPIKR